MISISKPAFSGASRDKHRSVFAGTVSLDPSRQLDLIKALNVNTRHIEYGDLPRKLHVGVVNQVMKLGIAKAG